MYLFVFLGLALLVLFWLLLIPIDLEGRAAWGQTAQLQILQTKIRILWLFGLVGKDLGGREEPKLKKEEKAKSEEKIEDETPLEEEKKIGFRDIFQIITIEGLTQNLERLATGLVGSLQVRFLRTNLRVGLDDPADTGRAMGLLWSVIAPLEAIPELEAEIEPSFQEEVFEGQMEGSLRFWPIRAISSLLRFIFSAPTLRAAWKLARLWRKG